MQINLDLTALPKAVDGKKTYISLALGALVIIANHYGLLPPDYAPSGLSPLNWINDLYHLLLVGTFRSAIAKVQAAKASPVT